MESTLYIALSRQLTITRQIDVMANNLANSTTAGFKGEETVFAEYLSGKRGKQLVFVEDVGLARDLGQGPLKNTHGPLDVAIKGNGWFVVRHGGASHYTRNGHFHLDQQGQLVTSAGDPVLGTDDSPITFQPTDTAIVIDGSGRISANGQARGQLHVVAFDDNARLDKTGGNLFRTSAEPKDAQSYIAQGLVEQSNVRPVIELTQMVKAMRGYREAQQLVDEEHRRQLNAIERLTRES